MTTRNEQQRGGALLPRPNRLILLALKAPRIMFHFNLGWIFGHRILVVTHMGRKSGLIHQTPLEVVRYDATTKTCIVISAWGEKSDWYRNIRQRPALQIEVGRDRYVPQQRFLTTDETEHELDVYVEHHGLSAKMLSRVLGLDFAGDPVQRRKFAESARMVAFSPQPENGS